MDQLPPNVQMASIELTNTISTTRMLEPGSDSTIAVLEKMLSLVLTNPVSALVELNILGIVANAFLIGVAMVLILPGDSPLFSTALHINQVIFKILGWVIRLLPIGIFVILFNFMLQLNNNTGNSEHFLLQLVQFAGLVVCLTLIHGLLILPLLAWLLTGIRPWFLFRQIAKPMLVAFSTLSSAATLPVTMQTCEEKLGVKRSVTSFVLPLGATMNMDGTALFEAVAAVFLAYLYGIELSHLAVIAIFLMAMISSIGGPGMPPASMAGMQIVL